MGRKMRTGARWQEIIHLARAHRQTKESKNLHTDRKPNILGDKGLGSR